MKRLLVVTLLSLAGCDQLAPTKWDAFVYPNRNDLTSHEMLTGFDTLELCRSAAVTRMHKIEKRSGGDYECGSRCKPAEGMPGMYQCDETLR